MEVGRVMTTGGLGFRYRYWSYSFFFFFFPFLHNSIEEWMDGRRRTVVAWGGMGKAESGGFRFGLRVIIDAVFRCFFFLVWWVS